MTTRRWRRVTGSSDEGAVTIFVIAISVILMAMVGIVVDGGNAINARQTTADDAEQAARAGATAIDTELLRSAGRVVIDQGLAQARARTYLQGLGYGTISFPAVPNATTFSVATTRTRSTEVLSIIGLKHYTVDATATARAATGITGENQ